MKESKTCFIIILILVPLVYLTSSFNFDRWNNQLIKWGGTADLNLNNDTEDQQEQIGILLRRLVRREHRIHLETNGFTCMHDLHSDICVASKEVRFDTSSLKMYIPSSSQELQEETVKPYALKGDDTAMNLVTPVLILHGNITPPLCHYNHAVPLIVFSSGGFASNFFHDMNDILIPLFLTSRHFRSNVRFVVIDFQLWFIKRYNRILARLSRYEVINTSATGHVHCFPGGVVGLKYHDNLVMNATDIPFGYSMFQFREFIMKSYDLKIKDVSQIEKPTLLLLSRVKSRVILNQNEVVNMMEEMGYRVVIATPNKTKDLDNFAHVVNSCSVLVGVHGAGLTHELFLANGAVTVQLVLLALDWPANAYFGEPAQDMGLEYLQYKIEAEESSLYDLYGPKHPVITDAKSIISQGFRAFKRVYLDKQNVTINVERFRKTLEKALRYIR